MVSAELGSHFGDPLREQRWLEDGSGVVELDHDVVLISGKDCLEYLNLLGTQKVNDCGAGQSSSTYLLNPQGHILYGFAFVMADDCLFGWTESGYGRALVDHLNRMKFRMDVQAELDPSLCVAWSGTVPEGCIPREGTPNCLGGYELFCGRDRVPEGNQVGIWAYTARRIADGIPRIGVDTDHRTLPNELGVPSEYLSLNKGCYPGQETVARVYNVGAPPRRLVRFHLDGSEEKVLPSGTEVVLAKDPEKKIGFLGSQAYHYELGPIGLGLVARETDDNADLLIGGVPARMEPLVARDAGLHVKTNLAPMKRRLL
ncbi:MAG: folate-binding protein [Propionibacteriaceae bacterium]|jgi:folate-binding protein YgfZ|nr:folate-binding protein [Propionibacteriaceae bacterium]